MDDYTRKFQSRVTCPGIGLHIKSVTMNKTKKEKILYDRKIHRLSFRTLAMKYDTPLSTIHLMVKKQELTEGQKPSVEELPDDVALLKEMLRKERLKNELLNNIIDIADQELGTNIRKKSGTRRSE